MKRFALFVGVNNYPGNRLKYARADAEVLRKRFAEYYDETRLLVDEEATKETQALPNIVSIA